MSLNDHILSAEQAEGNYIHQTILLTLALRVFLYCLGITLQYFILKYISRILDKSNSQISSVILAKVSFFSSKVCRWLELGHHMEELLCN